MSGKWSDPGRFSVITEQSGVGHTVLRPPNDQPCFHPVLLWGNDTGATPDDYLPLLKHFASHGFIVVAANTTQSGSGQEMLAGLTWLDKQKLSPFYANRDNVTAIGHGQGGLGAINAASGRYIKAVPIQPDPGGDVTTLQFAMFALAGQHDAVVPPAQVLQRYQQAGHVSAVYGEVAGADHLTPRGDGAGFRGPITAWLHWRMKGNLKANREFSGPNCGQCTSTTWSDFRRNTPGTVSELHYHSTVDTENQCVGTGDNGTTNHLWFDWDCRANGTKWDLWTGPAIQWYSTYSTANACSSTGKSGHDDGTWAQWSCENRRNKWDLWVEGKK